MRVRVILESKERTSLAVGERPVPGFLERPAQDPEPDRNPREQVRLPVEVRDRDGLRLVESE